MRMSVGMSCFTSQHRPCSRTGDAFVVRRQLVGLLREDKNGGETKRWNWDPLSDEEFESLKIVQTGCFH